VSSYFWQHPNFKSWSSHEDQNRFIFHVIGVWNWIAAGPVDRESAPANGFSNTANRISSSANGFSAAADFVAESDYQHTEWADPFDHHAQYHLAEHHEPEWHVPNHHPEQYDPERNQSQRHESKRNTVPHYQFSIGLVEFADDFADTGNNFALIDFAGSLSAFAADSCASNDAPSPKII
jgi:hypothetical protein